jgi:hypothetical protein
MKIFGIEFFKKKEEVKTVTIQSTGHQEQERMADRERLLEIAKECINPELKQFITVSFKKVKYSWKKDPFTFDLWRTCKTEAPYFISRSSESNYNRFLKSNDFLGNLGKLYMSLK